MSRSTQHRSASGYASRWLLSYAIPVAVAWPLYAVTHSAAAAVIGVIIGFILFVVLAARRQR